MFADEDFRMELLEASTEDEFKRLILNQAQELSKIEEIEEEPEEQIKDNHTDATAQEEQVRKKTFIFAIGSLNRSIPYQPSN